jgi:hypothetical protein
MADGTFTLTRFRSEHNHPLQYVPTVKDEEGYPAENEVEPLKNNLAMLLDKSVLGLRVTERLHRAHHMKGVFLFFNIRRSEKNTNNGEFK